MSSKSKKSQGASQIQRRRKRSVSTKVEGNKDEGVTAQKNMKIPESFETFRKNIEDQRNAVGPPLDFKFVKSRCKMLSKEQNLPESHGGIVYWMSRDQRVQDNWALMYAQRLALKEKVPLFVCFGLVPKFLEATLRQYAFMLKGLKLVRQELLDLNIPFSLMFGEAKSELPKFVKSHNIGGVVTDFSPLRTSKKWMDEVAGELPENVAFCQVDAHNIIPLWVTSDKMEYAARTIRTKIKKHLPQYLTEFPSVISHPHKSTTKFSDPFENWEGVMDFLEIDNSVPEVEWAKPGTDEALKTLLAFMTTRIKDYGEKRNDPNKEVLSNLSPWFHFGQISVARCILEVEKSAHSTGKAAFFEEAVVWRELADNFCYYNEDYDNLNGAQEWARKTLNKHKTDKRRPLYDLTKFEIAKTHDDLWNAAQNQMRVEGKMHGYLRMYWAKKILEWSESPEKALEIAIYLNDKYSLDGRDPNGFVGCMWSICGVHDQGFVERTIFGKIRYMSYEGCKRKFTVSAFVAKYRQLLTKEKRFP